MTTSASFSLIFIYNSSSIVFLNISSESKNIKYSPFDLFIPTFLAIPGPELF